MKKYVVTVEFIEKSNGVYYPEDSIYEANAQRCSYLRDLGFLGEEVKETKEQQKQEPPVSSGKAAARGAGEKNEPGKAEQTNNTPATATE